MKANSTAKKTPISELIEHFKSYYILLEHSMLGKKFDVIKCVSTRENRTDIIKADGNSHWFAADIAYAIEKNWFVPFSHTEYARLIIGK